MFDEFKARHGGLGPIQSLIDYGTHGALSSRIQARAVGAEMDAAGAAIKQDDTLSDTFKDNAAELLRHGVFDIPTALKNIEGLRAEVQAQHQIGGAFAPVVAGAQKLLDGAKNENERDILSNLLASADAASKLARDPLTRQQGLSMLGSVTDNVNKFTTQNRADDIAAEVRDTQTRRELNNTQFDRYKNSREELEKNSTPFVVMQTAYRSIQDLAQLKEPTPQTDQQLVRLLGQMLNPGVAIRPGEDPGEQYFAALGDKLGPALKYVMTGGAGLTAHERDLAFYAAAQRVKSENEAQVERNTRALNEGKAAELPGKYLNLLTLPPIDLGELGAATEPGSDALPPPTPVAGDDRTPLQRKTDGLVKRVVDAAGTAKGFDDVPSLTQFDRIRRLWSPDTRRQDNESIDAYEARIAASHAPPSPAQAAAIGAAVQHSNFGNVRGVYVPESIRNALSLKTDEF
jgi:hypothetical protein